MTVWPAAAVYSGWLSVEEVRRDGVVRGVAGENCAFAGPAFALADALADGMENWVGYDPRWMIT